MAGIPQGEPCDTRSLFVGFAEHSPAPLVLVSAEGYLLRYANPAFCKLCENDAGPLLGHDFTEAFPPSAAHTLRSLVDQVVASGMAARLDEQHHQRANGETACWSFVAWPLAGPEGHPNGIIVQVEDATETTWFREQSRSMNEALMLSSVRQHELIQKANLLSDQLQDARSRLEERIAERTAELTASNAMLRAAIARRDTIERERVALLAQLASAQEEERRKISRELHDQIGQLLVALALAQKTIENALPRDFPARSALEEIKKLTADISRKVHNLAVMLRPTVLDDLGLVPALKSYIHDWSERTGIGADFYCMGEMAQRLPPSVETAFYRVALEAAANVQRHANATHVGVSLQVLPDIAVLTVEDNGQGFDQEAAKSFGRLGLLGMRERIIQLGGDLLLESACGSGTTVIARVPLANLSTDSEN